MSQIKNKTLFKRNLNLDLLFTELIIFAIIQALGLYIGWRFSLVEEIAEYQGFSGASIIFLAAFIISTTVILLVIKFLKKKILFEIFFAFIIFLGAGTFLSVFTSQILAYILAFLIVLLRYLVPNVLTQNIAIILAITGIAGSLGIIIPVFEVLIILIVLSIYDIIAVYKTKHMVKMFKSLTSKGMILSIIIPKRFYDFTRRLDEINITKPQGRREYLFLGTGDLAFPIIFATSALSYGIWSSIAVILGALVGIFVLHVLLLLQKQKRAMPALPPIITCSILGLLISLLI